MADGCPLHIFVFDSATATDTSLGPSLVTKGLSTLGTITNNLLHLLMDCYFPKMGQKSDASLLHIEDRDGVAEEIQDEKHIDYKQLTIEVA